MVGNSGQTWGRSVTSKTVAIVAGPRYPSASVESAAPPSVEELRQVVPVSDMRGRLGGGPARCRMAGGYWFTDRGRRQLGVSVRTVERLVAALQKYARPANVGYRAIQRLKTKESFY